jgi:hypothetical protein
MAEDWASKIRESIDRSNKAMDLYRRQTQAGMMNAQSGGTTRYTAIENGGITDVGSFTPAPAGMSASQFSGGPIESASFYGSGQINEVGGASTPDGQPRPRINRSSQPMQQRLMGSAGGGGLNGFAQNQRNASSWENLQRRSNYMPPNQQTPRQRFTA